MSLSGFLEEFMRVDGIVKNCSFAFILGAGASVSSGIDAGGTLTRKWIWELYDRAPDKGSAKLEDWATAENLKITNFEYSNAAAFYPEIYDRRFSSQPDFGNAYLEDEMEDAEPNIGYSFLSRILTETRHKVVITTNFDNLVADALAIFTGKLPLVCGHQSLAELALPQLRRPLVAKIHNDLTLAPKSSAVETRKLSEEWEKTLKSLLEFYTPIVIGYGGNDGSLMNFLTDLEPGDIKNGIYWCYRKNGGPPNGKISDLVGKHQGWLIPIDGFDEFMLELGERLKYGLSDQHIIDTAQKRVNRHHQKFADIGQNLQHAIDESVDNQAMKSAMGAIDSLISRDNSDWGWQLKVDTEKDREGKKRIYLKGLREHQESYLLMGNFATFLTDQMENHEEAEQYYEKALALEKENPYLLGNYALFLTIVKDNRAEAKRLYREALRLDPDNVYFAKQIWQVRASFREAEKLYRWVLKQKPDSIHLKTEFIELLIAMGRIKRAAMKLKQAWSLNKGEVNDYSAALAFFGSLIEPSKFDDQALGRLKYILQAGFKRRHKSFGALLREVTKRQQDGIPPLYSALAAAIIDADNVGELDKDDEYPEWKKIEPIPIDEPWNIGS